MNTIATISAALRRRHTGAVIAVLLACAAPALAQDAGHPDAAEVAARYPRGSIDSVSAADAALVEVGRARAAVNARFAKEEQACLPLFFATSCVEKAKEKRRKALVMLRPVELESNAYKRQAKASERDADLAEKQEKAEAKRIEVESAPPPALREAKEAPPERVAKPGGPQTTEERVAEHEAKRQAREAKEQADAPKRAAKAAAYERKVQAAQKRQEEVAKRKAEKDEKQRARQQDERAEAPAVLRP
ncbi:MAG TPA: hypothetical protein VIM12_04515 [Noviherbaspirillum sp.]|jgi:hypothetical protein|uniref:hypothetical protein n=1 Tax=Noviherbaspirillum sp. TaxID=1926288 RepID=UPI002F955298